MKIYSAINNSNLSEDRKKEVRRHVARNKKVFSDKAAARALLTKDDVLLIRSLYGLSRHFIDE